MGKINDALKILMTPNNLESLTYSETQSKLMEHFNTTCKEHLSLVDAHSEQVLKSRPEIRLSDHEVHFKVKTGRNVLRIQHIPHEDAIRTNVS